MLLKILGFALSLNIVFAASVISSNASGNVVHCASSYYYSNVTIKVAL